MPVKARKDLVQDMVIHEEVDELTDVEYNRYSKVDYDDKET